jgi:hypothetical protein
VNNEEQLPIEQPTIEEQAFAEELIQATSSGPRILVYDIETAPIIAHVWGLWDNNVALNQIQSDWHILSWSAKWLGSPENEVMYMDQRNAVNLEDDRECLQGIWNLLDEADVVITQNGKKFDQKKLNARFILNGFQPPSSYKHIDTKEIASKHFGFTSNKLEYMTDKLCVKYKKLKHPNFQGHEMWAQCLKRNMNAFNEMEMYNKHDVLALEELYYKLRPWDKTINFNVYSDSLENKCSCGSTDLMKNGFYFTNHSKFQKYRCKSCGCEVRSKQNLFSKEKRMSLQPGTI